MRTSDHALSCVRSRRAEDDDFIVRLSRQAFAEFSTEPGSSTLRMARAGSTWVAEQNGAPVGFAVTRSTGPESAELCAIAVDEPARGVGVGGALLAKVEYALGRAGIGALTLHTSLTNSSALELFYKRGFRSDQRLPRFYRGVLDACVMHKRIGASARASKRD